MAWELTTWKPLNEMDHVRNEMDRLWNAFFERHPERGFESGGTWVPSLDVSETRNDFVVRTELPGINPKEIDISLSNGSLVIKGERKHEKEKKEENYHLVERSYGSFVRSVRLPREVNRKKITASYKDGVLKVVVPKSEEARKKERKTKVH